MLRLLAPLLALVAVLIPAARAATQSQPIRIGVLGPLTGGAAVIGGGEVNGIKLRVKQLNNEIAGRKVELIVEDDAGDPTTGLTKAQKLVERDRVEIFLGPLLSHVVLAVQDYVGQKGVPQLTFVAQPPEAAKYPTTFVPSWNAVQIGRLAGDYAVKKLGYRRAVIVSSKYVFGTRVSDGFRAGFTAAGGTIVKEVYPPLGTADFAPFVTGLPAADVVFSFFPGADAIKFVKARQEFGLEKTPLLAIASTVEGMLLPAQGDAALNTVAIGHYLEDFTIPANREFVSAYEKEYGKPPLGYYPALGYTLVQILEDALRRTGGKTDAKSLVEALKRVDVAQTPQGRFRFDPEKRYPIIDYYITRVVKKDGKLTHEMIDTLKDVRPE